MLEINWAPIVGALVVTTQGLGRHVARGQQTGAAQRLATRPAPQMRVQGPRQEVDEAVDGDEAKRGLVRQPAQRPSR